MVGSLPNAVAAYANATQNAGKPGMPARDTGQPSFAEALYDTAKDAVEVQRKGEEMAAKAVVGQADLTEVVTAVNNAELTVQTMVAVRDKVIQAYQEIIRMPM